LYRGRAHLELAKYEEALKYYQQAEQALPGSLRYLAKEGEGLVFMGQEKWAEAEKVWVELSKTEDNPLRSFHTWYLGLTQEGAKRPVDAIATYKDFESRFSDSEMIDKVRDRLSALQAGG
jgi:tetratricopeptide (TPR) repeat protein